MEDHRCVAGVCRATGRPDGQPAIDSKLSRAGDSRDDLLLPAVWDSGHCLRGAGQLEARRRRRGRRTGILAQSEDVVLDRVGGRTGIVVVLDAGLRREISSPAPVPILMKDSCRRWTVVVAGSAV